MAECVSISYSGPLATGCRSRSFPGTREQVPLVRRWLSSLLPDGFPPAGDAAVCITELAANAVLHSRSAEPGSTFSVRLVIARTLYAEVTDRGGPWVDRTGAGLTDPCGRGLRIVEALARSWNGCCGVSGDDTGRRAWFVMRIGRDRYLLRQERGEPTRSGPA